MAPARHGTGPALALARTAAEACDYGSAITKARRAAHRLVSAVNGCVCVRARVCVCVRARSWRGMRTRLIVTPEFEDMATRMR